MRANSSSWAYVAVVALATASIAAAMSIEAEPVKVTHRNSGPRYDIDAVARTKLANANQEQAPPQQPDRPVEGPESGPANEGVVPVGRVAIRRIFLFPVMRPDDGSESDAGMPPRGSASEREQENEREPMPSMFAKPFWPFMTPPSGAGHQEHERPHRPHLFGADEASRSPAERDQDKAASERGQGHPQQPMFDPIQMMMDLMHQAISSQLAPNPTDLNRDKEAPSNDNAPAETGDERPQVPGGSELARPAPVAPKNETSEDIVEIEGKKYLRKTVTSKHVGEGIIFMARRLIFVPLNETDPTTDTVATTANEQPTTAAPAVGGESEAVPVPVDRVGTNKPVVSEEFATTTAPITTTGQPSTTATSAPASSASSSVAPSTEQPITGGGFTVETVPEVVDKVAERLVEEVGAKSTPAPAGGETAKPAASSA